MNASEIAYGLDYRHGSDGIATSEDSCIAVGTVKET